MHEVGLYMGVNVGVESCTLISAWLVHVIFIAFDTSILDDTPYEIKHGMIPVLYTPPSLYITQYPFLNTQI